MIKSIPNWTPHEDKTLPEVLILGSQMIKDIYFRGSKSRDSEGYRRILKNIEGYLRIFKDIEGY